ncbi:uncharacterized protein ColSpa_00436 [Colletotrichum spaethianum]|uniref:Uncharacterized protein n=1 Tax=Colletotrichum spaethianum TaxID=700344 RepID=A0AA37L6D0_9PEZI|nr:uncharacterized protein ColSpa_00436 [Colletotrichum spaethianum]GKT40255.1 hypothetical protein ColSpa_00436 [Colletotrichum spaethianum]
MRPFLHNFFVFSFFILTVSASSPSFYCPTYIDTVVPSGQDRHYGKRELGDPFLATMHDVHSTLSKCSGIKSLKLRVTGLGCSEWPDRWSFPFDLSSRSHYPSKLEVLDLEGYQFDDSAWEEASQPPYRTNSRFWDNIEWLGSGRAWNWLKWFPLSPEQKAKTNLDLWIKAMDFSHIKELALRPTLNRSPDLRHLIPELKSLRSLTVTGQWAKDFILGLPENSLTSLSWLFSNETSASVLPVLRHHAQSLKRLEWREAESEYRQRKTMTPRQIAELGRMAPNLEKITFDINRNGTWPMEHLEALATNFPKVLNVTIFFEIASECRRQLQSSWEQGSYHEKWMSDESLSCNGIDSMAQPLLDHANAAKLFNFLREKKVGDEMTKAVFYAGDWERPWDGPMLVSDSWLEGRRAFMACENIGNGEMGGGPEGKGFLCQGIDTKVASEHSTSGVDDYYGPNRDPAWEGDLAGRAWRMEL